MRPATSTRSAITASPCGGCRQWLHEWRIERVYFRREDGSIADVRAGVEAPAGHWNLPEMKSGFVAVAGRPNVGKSTLVNALCGGKVAIVSDKPQTTRRRIFGIANGDDYQLVLADLPGFQRPLDALTERMQHTVDAAFEDVEAVLFVLSARERIGAGDRFIAKRVYALGVPVVIALNKVDRLRAGTSRSRCRPRRSSATSTRSIPVSAKTGDGIAGLRDELVALLPEGPLYFPAEQRTDLPLEAADRRADPREGAVADARRGAARDLRRGRGDGREGAAREHPRRDRVAEADPRRQGRRDGEGDRHARPAGDRGAARPPGLSSSSMVKVRPHWRRNEATLERLGL